MNEKLMKLMKGKKHGLSDTEKRAKMDVVKDLRSTAAEAMKDRIGGLKKVSVASDSEEGLKHGLDKAKEILGNPDQALADAESPAHDHETEMAEHSTDEQPGMMYDGGEVAGDDDSAPGDEQEHQNEDDEDVDGDDHAEEDEMSPEEIDEQIKRLMLVKQKKLAHK